MRMKRTFFLITVAVIAVASVTGQRCDVSSSLQDYCRCEADRPGAFKIICSSCKPNQTLTISNSDTSSLPPTVVGFHLHNCNSTVIVEGDAFYSFDNLENITFRSISSLTMKPRSLNVVAFHQQDLSLVFDGIMELRLDENAIKIEGQGQDLMRESLTIRDAVISKLPSHAISGSFNNLRLERVILNGEAHTQAINVGKVGAEVTIDVLDAFAKGLAGEWITGHVRVLTITNSNLLMKARAFAGIQIKGTPPLSITISHNKFGHPKWFVGNNNTHSEPSLPSQVFDLDISSPISSITSEYNKITCECQDLTWIFENPKNNLHSQLSFSCMQGKLESAIMECTEPSVAQSSSSHSKFLINMISVIIIVFH